MIELDTARHSLSHILAAAVGEIFKDVKFGIGPPIADGFYYDFVLPDTITEDDFVKIENKMREILKRKDEFVYKALPKADAAAFFKDQPFKLELIERIPAGEDISVYYTGNFADLCRGPHAKNSQELLNYAFKIRAVSGAYFGGDEKNAMMQRIYVYAFASPAELKEHMALIEEAKRRDHRILGPQYDLFYMDDTAPGMPYWLPKGWKMFNILLDFWRKEHEKRGYQEISAPLINDISLWQTSGHWAHYQHNMFLVSKEDKKFAAKPMNCPNAMLVYKRKVRSYRDLPLRLSDCDVLHRNEVSGTLHGLLRVQMFRQDDSHNFITEDQISSEINNILDIADLFYNVFGLTYKPVLSTRPADFMGDPALWDRAEKELKAVLTKRYGKDGFTVNEGDGAFYGPKIDMLMSDALKRTWQTGTIQLDFQLPRNFDLVYSGPEGKLKTPVVLHRVVYGSLERFIGILIEQFACSFPFWISAEQVRVLTIGEKHIKYASKIVTALREAGVRVQEDFGEDNIGTKIKGVRLEKLPYCIIIGDNEVLSKTISVRTRSGNQIQGVTIASFKKACVKMNKEYSLELTEQF